MTEDVRPKHTKAMKKPLFLQRLGGCGRLSKIKLMTCWKPQATAMLPTNGWVVMTLEILRARAHFKTRSTPTS